MWTISGNFSPVVKMGSWGEKEEYLCPQPTKKMLVHRVKREKSGISTQFVMLTEESFKIQNSALASYGTLN